MGIELHVVNRDKFELDEPVFLLRAQDISAPATLRFWAEENHRNGGDMALSELAEDHADRMEEWQKTHSAKPADLAREPREPTYGNDCI